ncbi:MAG: hypothetical protein WAV72_13515, partial [Bradyrhizobium sp.]
RNPRTFLPAACFAACCMLSISSFPNLPMMLVLPLSAIQLFRIAASFRTAKRIADAQTRWRPI